MHYQPIVDTQTLRICGAEALIRWRHPTKGIILPDQFIPLAEETGMITQIGEWLMQTACAEAATWPDDITVVCQPLRCSVQKEQPGRHRDMRACPDRLAARAPGARDNGNGTY